MTGTGVVAYALCILGITVTSATITADTMAFTILSVKLPTT